MGNTNNKTYSEVIQYNGSNIQFNILIRPEYIGELEVNGNKYNYIIDIKENIKQMINLFEKSYDTKERQQIPDVNQSIWKQLLYNEWKDLITKEVNIYQPNFGSGDTGTINETKFTNTLYLLKKETILPILMGKNRIEEITILIKNLS